MVERMKINAQGMKVSLSGNDVDAAGPYLFDSSLETLQIHESGVLLNCIDNAFGNEYNAVFLSASQQYPNTLMFQTPLPYIPLVFLTVVSTSNYGSNTQYASFPGSAMVVGGLEGGLDTFEIQPEIRTDRIVFWGRTPGDVARTDIAGDIYYTIFRFPLRP